MNKYISRLARIPLLQELTEDDTWVPKHVGVFFACYVYCIKKCICWKIC